MPVRDILLHLNSYPEPTPTWAVDSAAYIADRLNAKLSISLCEVYFPDVSNFLSQLLVHSREVIEAENHKSALNSRKLREKFETGVRPDLIGEKIVLDCPAFATAWRQAVHARTYDLSIVPIYEHPEARASAETLIFESGRPVLLLPPEGMAGHRFDDIVIAWDGSRAAARALAEGIGLCEQARSVTVLTVADDKDLAGNPSGLDAVRHLASHGIEATAVEIPLTQNNAGLALGAYCGKAGADLLVMGAYGHARLREFVLGGATQSILKEARLPVLLAH